MSSRDIDSTSENVLHDWAGEEAPVDEPEQPALDGSEADGADEGPAWGTATSTAEPLELEHVEVVEAQKGSIADPVAVEQVEEVEEVDEVPEPAAEDELEPDAGDVEIDETPMHVELSHE